jgi:hypothetical protein
MRGFERTHERCDIHTYVIADLRTRYDIRVVITKKQTNERLNQIIPKLTSPDLLTNQGLGNEIGFWIFDYPAEEEMAMRAFLHDVVMPALGKHQPAIRSAAVNLFDLVIGLLEERKLLDKAIDMQKTQGDAKALESLRRVLKEDKLAGRLVSQHDVANLDVLLLWNVGAVYPMLRTHTLLSALHPHMRTRRW